MKGVSRSEIEAILSRANLEMTPPRFAALNYLLRDNHPTVEQIIAALDRQYPRLSPETICTTLKTMCATGIIAQAISGDKTVRYNANVENENFKLSELEDD
ncbi:MAG: hypothetical protein NVSMB56_11000 [Pyrinomonadaceae bacterium]